MSSSPTQPQQHLPRGVTSPAFWGSFLGLLLGSITAGLAYVGLIGPSASSLQVRPVVAIFCCLLCVRYYASIVFLSYDDVASPKVRGLEETARKAVFAVQLVLIIGCSVNIAVLPVFGAGAATAVIVCQALSVMPYWRYLWRILLSGPEDNFHLLLALGDLAILVSACTFLTWEIGWFAYDDTGAGMCMGAILFVFIGECITTYRKAISVFVRETLDSLGGPGAAQQAASPDSR